MDRKQTYIYYILLLITAVLGMLPLVLMQHPLKWDAIDQAYPWKYFIGQCLQDGILPLWNPYQLLGSPIHADPQSSAWYPVTWFFGYFTGYDIYMLSVDFVLHIFLAGMGMFYLAKQLRFRDETAFIMGISYMLSGFFTGNAQHFMWIISGTWIPFILGAFLALKNAPSFRAAIRLGLAFFMIMTGGYPAFIILLLYLLTAILILFFIELLRKKDYRELFRFSRYLAVSAIFTILAGSVILVSVYYLRDAITRGSGVTLTQALFGAFTPECFISFLLPFASIREMDYYGTDLSMSNAYFGLLTLVFFITGLMIKRTKLVNLFLVWSLFCLAAAVGSTLPLREFLYHYAPFLDLFRFPALFRIFFILGFVIVAGFTFDEWRKGALNLAGKLRLSAMITGGIVLSLIIYSLFRGELNMGHFIKHQLLIFSEESRIVQHILFQGMIQLIFLVFFFLLITKWQFRKYALAAILVIAATDMILATRLNGPYTVYSHLFKSKDVFEHARQFPEGFPLPGTGPVIENKDSRSLVYKTLWRNLNIFHKQVSYEGYNPLHLKGFEEIADNHPKLFETVLQNPVIYLSDRVSPLDSLPYHEQHNNFATGRVYLDEEDYLGLKIEGLRLKGEGLKLKGEDAVILKSFSPVEVTAVCKTGDPALVNLLQNNYYGWEAKIDGQPAKISTGNMSFISVEVPAGEHEVVFSYNPKAVRIGFWVTLLVLAGGIILLYPWGIHFRTP